ncbi:cysteine synthase family protein [Mammaliicoccus sciuri]|uniref:PLP-dependent cysteine synthase family protein n=1 Tax=Mammaliicoccus sciuri TaxID=1296 RepID=UPI0013307FC3|nr:cysteine synthase family protein [Mammaliicoccus sciuri]MCD8836410.1 cysteine synthase family protein [Mammaliicoccus sciuri]MCJ0941140.1 cysteine synthase family protein [Mammaliicoccus sciuri]MCJ0965614.1 cysteine synthase family protein [Mammaliicoccus sciuri]MCJ1748509.1 cysteine synthase family protein [Mammaliicoccus sciuri]MEB6227721.1 cysteine synthase family protein [Mammaliicoccus sciuri]
MKAFDLIGNTPLVLLEHYSTDNVKIFAKLESYNLGGSVKDRLGKHLIEHALAEGNIRSGDTIVEATAGNTGIGLAIVANHYNMNCVIFAPEGFSEEKMNIMKALGAEVRRTPRSEGMLGARQQAQTYSEEYGAYYINQFENDENPQAYVHTLATEILEQCPDITHLIAGAGSGGTFTGIASVMKEHQVRNIIVEPEGSILAGGEAHAHDTEGIGVEKWPPFLKRDLIDDIKVISDQDAFTNVSGLALNEGILAGSSSGAALQAAIDVSKQIEQGHIVVIFPDGSDRYMSKNIFNYGGKDYE